MTPVLALAMLPVIAGPAFAVPGGQRLEARLEKTALRIDVADAVVDLPPDLAARVTEVTRGRRCDEALRSELEPLLLAADHLDLELTFLRSASLERLLGSYRGNWKRMMRRGLLDRDFDAEAEMARQRAHFAPIAREGLRAGDRFRYALRGETVSIRLVDAAGRPRLAFVETGAFARRAFLSAFFLKGAELRDGLLRSACR